MQNKKIKSDKIIDFPSEKWVDCVGYEGYYKVSNKGRIKSVFREVPGSYKCGGSFRRGEKLIKPKVGSTGYYTAQFCKLGVSKSVLVHRIVALAFIENNKKLPYVNHLDFNRLNNCLENLEWCDQKRNVHHAIENGRVPVFFGENTSNNKLTSEQVLKIFYSPQPLEEIAKNFGITRGQVGCIKSGKSWSHLTGKEWVRVRPFRNRKVNK